MYTEQLSQALSLAGTELDPVSQAVGTVTSGGVDLQKFRRALFVLQVGAVGAAGTVDAKLQQSASLATSYTDIAGSNITQITVSNKIVTLELRAGQLTGANRYVRLSVTVGGNAVLLSALAIGGEAIDKPGSAQDVAAVAQRLVL
jgi:hypothetical protein